MGFDSEFLELEPAPEDLLTCWGHEVSSKNLDLFFPKNVNIQGPSKEAIAGGSQYGVSRRDENLPSVWNGVWRAGATPVENQEQLRAVKDRKEFLKHFSRIISSNEDQVALVGGVSQGQASPWQGFPLLFAPQGQEASHGGRGPSLSSIPAAACINRLPWATSCGGVDRNPRTSTSNLIPQVVAYSKEVGTVEGNQQRRSDEAEVPSVPEGGG